MLPELLDLVDAAIVALEAGAIEVAKERLQAVAEVIRARCHASGELAFDGGNGEEAIGCGAGRER